MRRHHRLWLALGILAIIALWTLLMLLIGPRTFVEFIGVENSYVVIFLIAASGGLSSLTATSFYTLLATFAAAGLNPLLLGVAGGLGLVIGDSLFFAFGRNGVQALPPHVRLRTEKVAKWLESKPAWMVPLVVFLYAGFTPLPNDILMILVALTGTKYRRIIVPLIVGDIINVSISALLFAAGYGAIA